MKLIYTLFLALLINFAFAQDAPSSNLWYSSTARTMQQGRMESGIFSPLRLGLENKMELQVHPILFFAIPNARLKKNWTAAVDDKLQIATEHSFTYPTMLLKSLARSGSGGVLPATDEIPQILTLKNKLIVSSAFHEKHTVSFKAALEINALQFLTKDFTEIELLIVYPRTAAYHHFYTAELGVGLEGFLSKKISYNSDFRMLLMPHKNFVWAFEWNPQLYYTPSNKFRMMLGALLTTGNIPHEKKKLRLWPVLDLQFALGKKKG